MRKIATLFFLLIAVITCTFAQTYTADTISIDKRMFSANLNFQGKNLSLMKLEDLCKPFTDANDEVMMAKRNNNPALILTLVGAVLIGYSGVKWFSDGEFPWYYAAGGAVLIGGTIPLYIGSRNHTVNAARIYNYEIKHKQLPKPQ